MSDTENSFKYIKNRRAELSKYHNDNEEKDLSISLGGRTYITLTRFRLEN